MRRTWLVLLACAAALGVVPPGPADEKKADEAKEEELAKKLVTQCLRVRENELVQIGGGPQETALLEALAIHTRRQGAHPLVTLSTPRLARRMFDDVPEKFDAQKPEFNVKLAGIINAAI